MTEAKASNKLFLDESSKSDHNNTFIEISYCFRGVKNSEIY